MAAAMSGKLKTVTQMLAISLLILWDHLSENLQLVATVALWAALVATVVSGVEYFTRNSHVFTDLEPRA